MSNNIVISNNSNLPTPSRRPCTQAEYETWVKLAVDNRVKAMQTFTAWDITRAIRVVETSVEVEHEPVREIVHELMGQTPNWQGGYENYQQPDGSWRDAFTYKYVPPITIDTVANTQVQPPAAPPSQLNPGQVDWGN